MVFAVSSSNLEVEPRELADRIVEVLSQVAEIIAIEWAKPDSEDPTEGIVEAAQLSQQLLTQIREGLATSRALQVLTELQHQRVDVDPALHVELARDRIVVQVAQAIIQFWEHWVPRTST